VYIERVARCWKRGNVKMRERRRRKEEEEDWNTTEVKTLSRDGLVFGSSGNVLFQGGNFVSRG